jgi:hypothetical protein
MFPATAKAKIATGLLGVVVILVAFGWISLSRKVVRISLGQARECVWQINQWYSGKCVLSYYEDGIRKGIVQTGKGLWEWPIAGYPGLSPGSVIALHELDNTVAVFTIDLTEAAPHGVPPPAALSAVVRFSNFRTRACTHSEVAYLKDFISHIELPCQSTFPLNDCKSDPGALKRALLRAVDMGTIPYEQRTGDLRDAAQAQILPQD